MLIEVRYQCWGCGSERIEVEDEEIDGIPYPSKTVWNLCPDCTRRADEKRRFATCQER